MRTINNPERKKAKKSFCSKNKSSRSKGKNVCKNLKKSTKSKTTKEPSTLSKKVSDQR